jgi:hypothetical protein
MEFGKWEFRRPLGYILEYEFRWERRGIDKEAHGHGVASLGMGWDWTWRLVIVSSECSPTWIPYLRFEYFGIAWNLRYFTISNIGNFIEPHLWSSNY